MKYVKMLGLAAVAAAALMAFVGAGTASASMLCSAAEPTCTSANTWPAATELDFSLVPGTSFQQEETAPPNGEGEVLDRCEEATKKWKVTKTGSATSTVTGDIEVLTWGRCTWPTTTVAGFTGKFEVHAETGGNGTVTSDAETRVTTSIPLFGSCVFGVTVGTDLGTLTEDKGTADVLQINAVAKRLSGSSFTCPETSLWTAKYNLTGHETTTLYVSNA
jgi:hypothetical protein